MASIVYQTNKKSGYMYAYHAVAYRDPVTKKPTSRRTFIGRVDPSTKAYLHPEKAARRLAELEPLSQSSIGTQGKNDVVTVGNEQLAAEIQSLKKELFELKAQMARKDAVVQSIRDTLGTYV